MKLHTSIARLLRRCGYAVALTMATGSIASTAQQGTVIEFLTHKGGMPEGIANQSEYSFTLPLGMPEVPEGTTVWGTDNIEDALKNEEAYIKAYAPFRMNYNYEFFKLNDSIGDFSNRVMKVSNAIRPTLQQDVKIHTHKDTTEADGSQLRKISYFAARSFAPSSGDTKQLRSSLVSDDAATAEALRNGARVYMYKWENGAWKKEGSSYLGEPLMQADGTQAKDADGNPIYVYNTTYLLDPNKKYTIADASGNETEISFREGTQYEVARSGDYYLNRREQYLLTDTPIDVHDNLLCIDHSGFMLAVCAYSDFGDVYNNRTYIQDVRVSDDIFCAATYNGDAYNNTAVIIRAEAIGQNTTLTDEAAGVKASDYNNSGKVTAVFNGGNVNNDAWNNTVFVYGSSIYQDVTGAYTGGNATNNTVYISHSDISVGLRDVDPTRGGYSTRTGTANNNTVIIDDTLDADAAGIAPEIVDNTVAGGWTSSVPEVSTIHEDIQGGATSRAYGENGAHYNKVIVLGATAKDGTRTTIEGNVFGGVVLNNNHTAGSVPEADYDLPAASATNNLVYIKGAQMNTSVITSILKARSEDDNVWGDWVVSTDVGRICGGYAGAPQDIYKLVDDPNKDDNSTIEEYVQQRTPGNANDNTVIVIDTRVGNSIYGGTNLGTGQASNNELHLSQLDTTNAENPDEHNDFVFYGGWIDTYATQPHSEDYQGHTNNNQVWLYDTGWSMDNTYLHGGWGKGIRKDEEGLLIWKDEDRKIEGAASFDGERFYDKNQNVLATLTLSQLVAGESGDRLLGSGVAAFDGEYFYDYARNNIGTYQNMSVGTPVYTNGKLTSYKDIMPAVTSTKTVQEQIDGAQVTLIKFYTQDNVYTDSGATGPETSHIATYYPANYKEWDEEKQAWDTSKAGTIRGIDDAVLLSGIEGYDAATQSFTKGNTVLATILSGTIVNSSDKVMAWGISDTTSSFDTTNGNYYFRDSEGNIIATFLSSSIDGQDVNGNDIHIDIFSYETDDKNGITMYKRGELSELFERLTGYDEYIAYTRDNWLHIAGFQGSIKGFDHFEQLRFYFTKDIDLETPMLTITGSEDAPTALSYTNEDGSETPITLTADISAIAEGLKPGDIIPVIAHEEHETTPLEGLSNIPHESVVDDEMTYTQGVTRKVKLETTFYEMPDNGEEDMPVEGTHYDERFQNMGVIEVLSRTEEVTPESKSLLEGRIATLTLNNMGGNLLAEQGIDSACRGLENAGSPGDAKHFIPVEQNGKGAVSYAPKSELHPGGRLFFAMSGSHNKVDSGSDVDVDGTNALVGIAHGMLEDNALTLGVFLETGWGKYHTNNNFGVGANVPYVRGTGETSYVGAGALLRYRLGHLSKKLSGVSLDASVRAGRQETDFSTADLTNYGTYASYEHESAYLAGHVGVNYAFKPSDKLTTMLYARYLWTHVSNEDADVCSETVSFDDMHSNRFRFGGRLSWHVTENWTPYVGAAYEWECSGTARANTHGMGITAPSMRGGSVIGEAGVIWQPNVNRALWLEAAVQGSAGKNENLGARFGVSIGF